MNEWFIMCKLNGLAVANVLAVLNSLILLSVSLMKELPLGLGIGLMSSHYSDLLVFSTTMYYCCTLKTAENG